MRPDQASNSVRRVSNLVCAAWSEFSARRLSMLQQSRRYCAAALAQNCVSGRPQRMAAKRWNCGSLQMMPAR